LQYLLNTCLLSQSLSQTIWWQYHTLQLLKQSNAVRPKTTKATLAPLNALRQVLISLGKDPGLVDALVDQLYLVLRHLEPAVVQQLPVPHDGIACDMIRLSPGRPLEYVTRSWRNGVHSSNARVAVHPSAEPGPLTKSNCHSHTVVAPHAQ
jgi:hypothetical protein